MRRVLFLAVGLALALPAAPCWACSCAIQEPKEHTANADTIFTGVVTSVENRQELLVVTVDAETSYKGSVDPRMEIRTPIDSAACGIEFTEGVRYTIFTYRDGGELHTGLCTGTLDGPIDPPEYGLSAGTTIAAPLAPAGGGVDTDPARWTWALIAPAAIVIALLLWILVARARRSSA